MEKNMTNEQTKAKLQRIMDNIAEEIKNNGVDTLWKEAHFISGAEIVIQISPSMIPSIEYRINVVVPGNL